MAAIPGFYGGNALISYPFVADPPPTMTFPSGSAPLPPATIVEFLADVAPEGGYTAATASTRLASISRAAGVVTFAFTSGAAAMAGSELRFAVAEADPPWTTVVAESAETAGDCAGAPLWAGILAIGDLGPLLALLADGEAAVDGPTVEPTAVRAEPPALRAISVGNVGRTTTGTPPDPQVVVPFARCLVGDVSIVGGANVSLRQDASVREIAIDAVVGAGAGTPCGEIKLDPAEVPPVGSTLLSGGPSCREVITSISGVEGRKIHVKAGPGITVSVDPAFPHRLTIGPAAAAALGCEEG